MLTNTSSLSFPKVSMIYIIVAVTIIWIISILYNKYLFAIRLDGYSMSPTFLPGDTLVLVRGNHTVFIRRGIAVLINRRSDDKSAIFIKRLVALPGETFHLEKHLYTTLSCENEFLDKQVWAIPDEHYFVLGDNNESLDSRIWGPIRKSEIIGIVLFRIPRLAQQQRSI